MSTLPLAGHRARRGVVAARRPCLIRLPDDLWLSSAVAVEGGSVPPASSSPSPEGGQS